MLGRIIAIIVLVATLALIYLAPQGLLTKPTLDEVTAGPFYLRGLEELDVGHARARLLELSRQDREGRVWRPTLINDRLVDDDDLVELAFVSEDSVLVEEGELPQEVIDAAWPRGEFLLMTFPYRGPYSPTLGEWKVYKGLFNEARKRGLEPAKVLEIYDEDAEEIRYWFPLE